MLLGTMAGERVAYAITQEGVVWQYSGNSSEPRVLSFPSIAVGTDVEEAWCALGQLAHVGAVLDRPPIGDSAVVGTRGLWASIGLSGRGRSGTGNVRLAEIDLVEEEQSDPLRVQPLLELPAAAPVIGGGEGRGSMQEWVAQGLVSAGLAPQGWKLGISYALFHPVVRTNQIHSEDPARGSDAPRASARVSSRVDMGGDVARLALIVGDLSSKRGWDYISPDRLSHILGGPSLVPDTRSHAEDSDPEHSSHPPTLSTNALVSPYLGPELHEESDMSKRVQWAPLQPPSPISEVGKGRSDDSDRDPWDASARDPWIDYVELSVDTLEIPLLPARVLHRLRRSHG